MGEKHRNIWLYPLVFFGTIFVDRLTKWWAVTVLPGGEIQLFPGLNFSLAWNRGVSWGLFGSSSPWGLYLLSSVIALVIVFFTAYTVIEYKHGRSIFLELIVIAGALSNFVDRLWYGAVVDFVDVYALHWHWPTFNIADACIVVGICGIAIKGVLCERQND